MFGAELILYKYKKMVIMIKMYFILLVFSYNAP